MDSILTPLLLEAEVARLKQLEQLTPERTQHRTAVAAVALPSQPVTRLIAPHTVRPLSALEQPIPSPLPRLYDPDRLLQRALEMLPGLSALFLISALIWGVLLAPRWLALLLLAFDVYWVWRSYNTAFHALKGHYLIRREQQVNWRARYEAERHSAPDALAWDDVRHVVIIPNYDESIPKLRATLEALAAQEEARQKLFVVLAMEAAVAGADEKAAQLEEEFRDRFAGILTTFHPPDLAGEVRGKSSNEAWAAKLAKRWLVDEQGYDIRHLTVTSCDADTVFHPNYFGALTCKFALHPKRYRRFWQAPIFLHSNIWDVPAPLRIPNGLGSQHHLARLSRRFRMLFPQSTYSLSLKMADDVGYWDVDVIPEDWHMFLKCFFTLGGDVDVEPIHLPLKMDGARSHTYLRTFYNHYQQARRHAWGATDIPYAIRNALRHPEISLICRLRRAWAVYETHVLWSSQWFLITAPGLLFGSVFGAHLTPDSFSQLIPPWFKEFSRPLLLSCIVPLVTLIILDTVSRPPRPRHFGLQLMAFQFLQWFFMGVITFCFNALPSLDAQMRLLLGKRLEYKVTEKA